MFSSDAEDLVGRLDAVPQKETLVRALRPALSGVGNRLEWPFLPLPCPSEIGALGRTRTSDTRFRKPVLYPLSYEGVNL